jgi:hypothetical protein
VLIVICRELKKKQRGKKRSHSQVWLCTGALRTESDWVRELRFADMIVTRGRKKKG